MPKKVDECIKALKEKGYSEDRAWSICQAQFRDEGLKRSFADAVEYDPVEKTAVSIRDGVLEYLGSELGLQPEDKVFTVYRSPATIAKAALLMPGIPFTDEHVSIDDPAPDTGSTVTDAEVIDLWDDDLDARLGVRNHLSLTEPALETMQTKRELSLGYRGVLVPHQKYDYEQRDIVPHHLAGVPCGRCGSLCSFIDKKPKLPQEGNMPRKKKAFFDEEGAVNLEQVVQIASELPEAIKSVPVDKLQEIMPALMEIISYAKAQGVPVEEEIVDEDNVGEEEVVDEDNVGEEEVVDEDKVEEEDKPKFSDADLKRKLKAFADAEVKKYSRVIDKARNFLDETYDYTGKTAAQVMRDALATQSTDSFTDSELDIAFKLLRKPDADYSKFGDSKPEGSLTARIKKEMGE